MLHLDLQGTDISVDISLSSLYVIQCILYIQKNINNFKLNSDFHYHNTRYRNHFRHELCSYSSTQINFEFMALKLFNSLPNSTKILDYGTFNSLIKRKFYEHPIYTIQECFNIVFVYITYVTAMGGSPGDVSEVPVTWVKHRKG